jgi:alkylhydroperoxidase family enzyme
VRDHNGYALAYVYFENEPGRRAAANLLTKDEAQRRAINIASCPSCSAGHRRKARRDEVAAAHFKTVCAMNPPPQFPKYRRNAI